MRKVIFIGVLLFSCPGHAEPPPGVFLEVANHIRATAKGHGDVILDAKWYEENQEYRITISGGEKYQNLLPHRKDNHLRSYCTESPFSYGVIDHNRRAEFCKKSPHTGEVAGTP